MKPLDQHATSTCIACNVRTDTPIRDPAARATGPCFFGTCVTSAQILNHTGNPNPILLGHLHQTTPEYGCPAVPTHRLSPIRSLVFAAWHSIPVLARRAFALELSSTALFTLALACVEAGVIAVYVRQSWDGIVPEHRLNLLVALVASMGELANILSFFWSSAAHGRAKIPFINTLQVITIALIGIMAALPREPWGLYTLVVVVMVARTCWSGIVTIRPTTWRANYPQHMRARIVGAFQTAQVVVIAIAGVSLGIILDQAKSADRDHWLKSAYAYVVPALCVLALLAVPLTRRIRVRRERSLLANENKSETSPIMKPWQGPLAVVRVLKKDPWYAQFQLWMFVLGFGNLMLPAVLVITIKEQFQYGYLKSILISSTLQSVMIASTIPLWARFLDRAHVVRFRSIHSWVFVLGGALLLTGVALHRIEFIVAGVIANGIGFGGGAIAWNLGHVDFSPPSQTGQYMATHVTLNGIRGLIAPLVSVTLYESLKAFTANPSIALFGLSLVISITGAFGFVHLRIAMGKLVAAKAQR